MSHPIPNQRVEAVVVAVVGLVVVGIHLWWQWAATGSLLGLPLDDSYIHLEFARHLAAGDGLVFSGDRPVPGTTSPLWTALLSPALMVSGGIVWAKLLGVALFLLAALEVGSMLRALGTHPTIARLGTCLFLLTETMAFSALSGMEVPLFVWLGVRGVRLFVEETAGSEHGLVTPSFWVLSVAALARPEGILLLGLAIVERVARGPRLGAVGRLRGGLALAALTILPTALYFVLLHGSPLPTTFEVKAGGGHRWMPATRDLWRIGEILFRVQPWMTFLAGAGVVSLLRRGVAWLPATWFLALPAAFSAMTAPGQVVLLGNFGRYAFPLLPFVVVLGCLAADEVVTMARGVAPGRARGALAVVAVLLVLAPAVRATFVGASRSALAVRNVEQSDVAAARWIAANLPAGARIGAQDIGALGYFTDHPVVDLVGLVNPEILPYLRGERRGSHPSGLAGMLAFAREQGVDHLLLFPRSYGGLEKLRSVEPRLRVLRTFRVERNVAMAGEELVLLAMPGP